MANAMTALNGIEAVAIGVEAIDPEVAELARQESLRTLIAKLQESCDELVESKRDIESRMVADLLRYRGDDPDGIGPTKQNFSTGGPLDEVPQQIPYTRARVDVGAARARDSAFPDHDQPWTISADPDDPDPSIVEGIPPEQVRAELNRRIEAIEEKVQTDLNRAKFTMKGRSLIDDQFQLGTGIMYGPVLRSAKKSKITKAMTPIMDEMGQPVIGPDGQPQTQMVTMFTTTIEEYPDLDHVSPFNVFFDAGSQVEDCTRAFRYHLYSKAQLLKLKGQPGFDDEAIQRLHDKEPADDAKVFDNITRINNRLGQTETLKDRYCVWQFDGILTKEELDCMCDEKFSLEANESDPVLVQIWFCQGEVIFKRPGLILDDTRLPYYVVPYEKIDDTVWGVGLSYQCKQGAAAIRLSQKQIQNAANCASGWVTLYRNGLIDFGNKIKSISGPTLVPVDDDTVNIKDVFENISFPDTTGALTAWMNRQIEMSDESISLPLIAQGAPSTVQQTASGQAMLMNSNNVVQRRIAMNIDDNLIVPVVERFARFRQLFSPSDDMMVDFTVTARGMTNLIRDIQSTKLLQFKQMVDADPELQKRLKPDVWLREMARTGGIPLDDMWRSDEEVAEIEAQMQPPVDPQVEITKMKIESEQAIAQMNAELKQMEMQTRLQIAEVNRATAELQLAADENLTLEQIRAKTDFAALQEQTKRIMGQAKIRLEAEKLASQERRQTQEIRLKLAPAPINPTRQGI